MVKIGDVSSWALVSGVKYFVLQNPNDPLPDEYRHADELFPRLSTEQLLIMVRSLHESHDVAKRFNSDDQQRTVLWNAGMLLSPNYYSISRKQSRSSLV